jgi:threo-3-hydroxy-L-aspartate ammonia-lyase
LVEPSGAAAAAAVLFRRLPEDVKRVGVVLSGGNIDSEMLSKIAGDQPQIHADTRR